MLGECLGLRHYSLSDLIKVQESIKLSPMLHLAHGILVLVQEGGNAKKNVIAARNLKIGPSLPLMFSDILGGTRSPHFFMSMKKCGDLDPPTCRMDSPVPRCYL
jgi:hypothetical protein